MIETVYGNEQYRIIQINSLTIMNKQVENNSHVTCDSIYFFAVSHNFMKKSHCYLQDDEPLKDITKAKEKTEL